VISEKQKTINIKQVKIFDDGSYDVIMTGHMALSSM
jgi:hypothetical protein